MLGPSPRGDRHNFSRFVRESDLNGARVFRKPRPVFWELFFFGGASPLKSIFSATTIGMSLELKSSRGPFDSDMLAVETAPRPVHPSDYYALGQLLAFCYYFGLQDMHKDNLLLSPGGLQVIDAEQAFSELLLPNQTLLLPANKDIPWSAGLNILTGTALERLPNHEAKVLLDGFVDLTSLFIENLGSIRSVLRDADSDMRRQPIRIFFRGTREYVEHLDGKTIIADCFEEEAIQLARGDVPYFFMFTGSGVVYFYSSSAWAAQEVAVPVGFRKFVDYCAKEPSYLFTREKIERQWARGMLFLSKKLESLNARDLVWDSCSVTREAGQLNFVSPALRMSAKN